MGTVAPIETERLRLIPIDADLMQSSGSPADLAAKLSASIPPTWRPIYDRQTLDKAAASLREWPNYVGWGGWYAIHRETNRLVGYLSFGTLSFVRGIAMVGYEVVPEDRKQGFATEATAALVQWAFKNPDIGWVMAETDWDNVASQRVMEKVGMQRLTSDGEGFLRYGIQNPIAGPKAVNGSSIFELNLCPFNAKVEPGKLPSYWEFAYVSPLVVALAFSAVMLQAWILSGMFLTGAAVVCGVRYKTIRQQRDEAAKPQATVLQRVRITSLGLYWTTDGPVHDFLWWDRITKVEITHSTIEVSTNQRKLVIPNEGFCRPLLRERLLNDLRRHAQHAKF